MHSPKALPRLELLSLLLALPVAVAGQPSGTAGAQSTTRPQLVVQLGHFHEIETVAFSPDGRTMLTACADKTAKLWDVETGLEIRTFAGHTDRVTGAVFSPDGRTVLTASWDKTAKLWNVETGRAIRTFTGHDDSILSAAFSPRGDTILTGSADGSAILWDVETAKAIRTFKPENAGQIKAVAFMPDGRRVLTAGSDGSTILWDTRTGQALRSMSHPGATAVAASRDGRLVATGDNWGGKADLWDAATGQQIRSIHDPGSVTSVAFSPDGRALLVGNDADTTATLWNAETGQMIRKLTGHSEPVWAVAFSPDGRRALTGSNDGIVKLWDLATGEEIRTFAGHADQIWSVAFSPDGRRLLAGGGDKLARLWDVAAGRQTVAFEGHPYGVTGVAFSPGGRTVLTSGIEGTAVLSDAETGRVIRTIDTQAKPVEHIALSPDGHRILIGSPENIAQLFDAETGQEIRSFKGHKEVVDAVAFSPDGHKVLTGSWDDTAMLWNADTGERIFTFKGHTNDVTSVAFSPDGRTVLTGSDDHTAKLWDAGTGNELRTFTGHTDEIWSVAFSPDGRRILTGSSDNTAKMWDAETGQELRTFAGNSYWVRDVAFSPDGRRVMTAGADGTVRIWDADTARELCSLVSFNDGNWAVVDPEGRFDSSNLDGGAPLAWVVPDDPMRPLPLEIFMRDYYTPRLLARILSGETLPPIRSIAEIGNRVQPEVAIVSVSASKAHPGRADVVVHAASRTSEKGQPSGLQDLRLFRNGQLVGYREDALHDGDFAFNGIQLPTAAQSVAFTAYAFNSERIKSATAQKEYRYTPGPPAKPRAWLVQIGVNRYQAAGCDLHGSANDAGKLSQLLANRLAARGLIVKPDLLVSDGPIGDATKAKIRSALAAIAASATPDDVFFLSFSGHGYSNQRGQFYILPSDVQGSCQGVDDRMLQSAISAGELTEWLRPIDAGQLTFILDSCDSASSVESNNFKPGPMGSPGLGQLAYDKRMRILAASQPNQAARESDTLHQGLLTYALTQQGLVEGHADWNPVDSKIMVGEWLSYAADAVPRFFESGAVKTQRGLVPVGEPEHDVPSAQTPALFDFSRTDAFVLQ
ncbi:MAG: caspase family protein [Terracidiphilus sp.]|jgi:WD40 repeat protein